MGLPILGDVIREVGGLVRQVLPDPKAQAELDYKFAELADKADERETSLLLGQIEVNKVEASSSNLFVAGWRPAIGWVSAAALGWTWMVAPLLKWIATLAHFQTEVPALPGDSIYPIVLAMLGVGTMRTVEKMRGVATSVNGTTPVPTRALNPNTTPTVPIEQSPSLVSRWFK